MRKFTYLNLSQFITKNKLNLLKKSSKKYSPTVNWIKNCDNTKNPVIKLQNYSLKLLDNCDASSESCSDVSPYQTAMLRIRIIKNSVTVYEPSFDICNDKNLKPFVKLGLGVFGIPRKCPVNEKQRFCYNKTIVASLTKRAEKFLPILLSINQDVGVEFKITHDTGSSCFQAEFNVQKT